MSFIQTNPIFQAVTNVSVSSLNNAMTQGHKINETENEDSITALDYAILTLKYSMVKPILVYVNLLIPSEKSKMLNSALKTLVKCMEKYLNANREENIIDDMTVFNDLKTAGADLSLVVNVQENHYLYNYAIKLNSTEIFDILIANNIDSNVYDGQGNNILMYAFMYDRRNFIPTLITRSNNLTCVQNYSKKSFLHYAVERNCFEIVQQLLTLAPELLYLKDEDSKTALHYVVERYTKEIAHTYIDYFVGILEAQTEVSNALLPFLNSQDFRGDTALHYAIEKANSYSNSNPGVCNCMIKKLISKGSSLYIKNNHGMMPIDLPGVSKELVNEIC